MTKLIPRAQPLEGWLFDGRATTTWPSWVKRCCQRTSNGGEPALRLERRSGPQLVYQGEWLVRDLDGGVSCYTPEELEVKFKRED